MQISKTRNGTAEVAGKLGSVNPKARRALKVAGSESNTSPLNLSKFPSERSPKTELRVSKTMEIEKRRTSRVTELEFQIIQLQEELKTTRDQVNAAEARRRWAQQEADETKKQLQVVSLNLEDSQTQMAKLSASEEARIQELRKISQERDRTWQSELEAIQKQHSIDSAALASAMNETRRLRLQLEMALRSESALAKQAEADQLQIQSTKEDLAEASIAIENLKFQLGSSEKAEAEVKSILAETRKQLEVAQNTTESLLADGSKLMESFTVMAIELKESRLQVKALEEEHYAPKTQTLLDLDHTKQLPYTSEDPDVEDLMSVEDMMSAVEESWVSHQEEQIEIFVKIQSCHEMMERMRTESESLAQLSEENERLKLELVKMEAGRHGAREAEEKALMKLGFASEEAEKSSELAARAAEELKMSQAKKVEVEAELRKLKVQMEQWKKAAEAAIVMLTDSDQGREAGAGKTESLTFSDESDDEAYKKKKSYVVRRIRGMWNKEQK